MQLSCPRPIASLLVNLAFESVQLEEGGSVLDRQVDEVHCLSQLVLEEIVLRQEVVEPELHSWVLLFLVTGA